MLTESASLKGIIEELGLIVIEVKFQLICPVYSDASNVYLSHWVGFSLTVIRNI